MVNPRTRDDAFRLNLFYLIMFRYCMNFWKFILFFHWLEWLWNCRWSMIVMLSYWIVKKDQKTVNRPGNVSDKRQKACWSLVCYSYPSPTASERGIHDTCRKWILKAWRNELMQRSRESKLTVTIVVVVVVHGNHMNRHLLQLHLLALLLFWWGFEHFPEILLPLSFSCNVQ